MPYAATLTPDQLFTEVWQQEFEPVLADKRRRAAEYQTEAFLEITLTLCGEEVRQLTPHDLILLDALGNPFIAGAADGRVTAFDCASFLWEISTANNHTPSIFNLFRRRALMKRLATREIKESAREIVAFVDRMLGISARAKEKKEETGSPTSSDILRPEPKTHFLTPLLVNLSSEMGATDPVSGRLLSQTPLPRLLQYAEHVDSKKSQAKTYTEIDGLKSQCMDRVNQIVAERRAAAAAS